MSPRPVPLVAGFLVAALDQSGTLLISGALAANGALPLAGGGDMHYGRFGWVATVLRLVDTPLVDTTFIEVPAIEQRFVNQP